MKNLELRASLIKSGVLLILCIFFIYAFAVGDSGGVGGTIGSIFSGILFLIGLTFALVLSVLVLFAIYFGILYLYNPDVSKKTYNELKATCTAATANLPISKCCSSKKAAATSPAVSVEDLQVIVTNQAKLGVQLENIGSTVETLQKSLNSFNTALSSTKDEIATLKEKATSFEETLETKAPTTAIDDSAKKLSTELENLKSSLKPLTDKVATLEKSLTALGSNEDEEGDDVQVIIDKAVNALKAEIQAVQSDMSKLSAPPATKTDTKTDTKTILKDDDPVHRILEYFTKKADEKKFVTSVQKAVDQGMTYAKTDEFLGESLSKEAGAIIVDHPSLTKDYIRTIRQKN